MASSLPEQDMVPIAQVNGKELEKIVSHGTETSKESTGIYLYRNCIGHLQTQEEHIHPPNTPNGFSYTPTTQKNNACTLA